LRRILHIDMDAFFAAVEQKRHPELIGKPVVIGGEGNPAKRGVVSTASYEARKYGIHSAMPLRTAYKLCPQAVFLPVDYPEYSRVSRQVKAILREFSPVMEDVGIDEAFLDISLSGNSSEAVAREIKEKIRDETGLTCSIGIAPNKLLAKIASDLLKPDGCTIVTEENAKPFLWPLAVRKLRGVGPKTEEALQAMGIQTIQELASLPLEALTERFGPSYGRYLYQASRGMDESPLITHWEPKSISRETTFQEDVGQWQALARTLADLTRDVVMEMKEEGYKARTFTVKVRFSDFETLTRALTLPEPTDSETKARHAVFACFKRVEIGKKVRLLGVRAGNLEKIPSHP
jgi:DNA polymerase-4